MKSFANDLRRVVLLSHLLNISVEYLNMNTETPGNMASAGMDIQGRIERYKRLMQRLSPGTWPQVQAELESDQIQDILLLIEEMFTIQNVGDVVELIRSNKVAA